VRPSPWMNPMTLLPQLHHAIILLLPIVVS